MGIRRLSLDIDERRKIAKAVRERSIINSKDPAFLEKLEEVQNIYGTIKSDKLNKKLSL